jgi:hypothetical protein
MNAVIAVTLLATEAMVATAASAPTFVASFTEYLHVEGREHEHVREARARVCVCVAEMTHVRVVPLHYTPFFKALIYVLRVKARTLLPHTTRVPHMPISTRPEYFLLT